MKGIIAPSVRRLREMKEVLFDRKYAASGNPELPLYYMHRAVGRRGWLRYDVTVMPPLMLGSEYAKTAGHYHCLARRGLAYPEIYEVLRGAATYIMQRREKGKIADVIICDAKAGDKVLMPPNYGHVTVNRSRSTLIMANIVSDHCMSDYSEYRKMHGAAYYIVKGKGIIPNPSYKSPPKPRHFKPGEGLLKHPLPQKLTLYQLLENSSRLLNFLDDPRLL